ncbi:MAG: lipopolysaccharide assembly protein LapA domain-containing protein [Rhodospirillaceae bacterium]|nr:lipopolysaccharide assembly protein LapA domain-containing protein [Rhodospirillaceae bacterium]
MKLLHWFVTVPIAVAAVLFAVMNRAPVTIDLWPMPWRIEAPAFLILLGSLAVGLLIGLLLSWLTGGTRRRRMRQLAHENERLATELRELRREAAERSRVVSPPASSLPVPVPPAGMPTGLPPAQGPGQV